MKRPIAWVRETIVLDTCIFVAIHGMVLKFSKTFSVGYSEWVLESYLDNDKLKARTSFFLSLWIYACAQFHGRHGHVLLSHMPATALKSALIHRTSFS